MRIMLVTEHSMFEKARDVAQQMDRFDPSFSQRYLEYGFEWQGEKFYTLYGESHYEADKYHIFYIDVGEGAEAGMTGFLKEKPWCQVIARADERFCMAGDPLYKSDDFYETIPRNVIRRPSDFTPRKGSAPSSLPAASGRPPAP